MPEKTILASATDPDQEKASLKAEDEVRKKAIGVRLKRIEIESVNEGDQWLAKATGYYDVPEG